MIKSWSFSRYACYVECPRKAKYKFIDKLPEPPSPAMARGIAIHKLAEDYAKGSVKKLPKELKLFEDQFNELRDSNPKVEESWTFKQDWSETTWNDWAGAWLRVKVDASCFDGNTLYIIDHKTGKEKNDYHEQTSLYAASAIIKYPTIKTIKTQLWYLDSGGQPEVEYSAKDANLLVKDWEKKVVPMLSDTMFPPRPGNGCRFCPFSKSKGGPCKF